ncbi:cell division ATP-binding protein FtsE [uncultured Phocaeicola sp.]|uniref:cell division ATP-binding protein FtsE n=1 Tax=uncultured Phocaeicola sp. TaxID=990718 RepID=UPI0025A646D7|nr:ATP-binding cassette domain-containing protein [uncultured Phocaeicola sp.]
MDEPLIRYKNVNINQQELDVLEDVNLELNKGEFVYLIGKVGSGKTSLLKTIYGELDIQSGDAEVLGYNMTNIKRKHIPELRRRLGIVFQDFQLLTDRNVHSNLSFVLRATGWSNKAAIKERIDEVLEQVGMTGKGYKMPNELSGGEQQRIVIARAILNRPEIILADEPTGNLDAETGRQIVELLKSICASGSAIMMTTHNLHLLAEYPGIVYRFENHQIKEVTNEYSRIIKSKNEQETKEKVTNATVETIE